jgi:hypothetical protein
MVVAITSSAYSTNYGQRPAYHPCSDAPLRGKQFNVWRADGQIRAKQCAEPVIADSARGFAIRWMLRRLPLPLPPSLWVLLVVSVQPSCGLAFLLLRKLLLHLRCDGIGELRYEFGLLTVCGVIIRPQGGFRAVCGSLPDARCARLCSRNGPKRHAFSRYPWAFLPIGSRRCNYAAESNQL